MLQHQVIKMGSEKHISNQNKITLLSLSPKQNWTVHFYSLLFGIAKSKYCWPGADTKCKCNTLICHTEFGDILQIKVKSFSYEFNKDVII